MNHEPRKTLATVDGHRIAGLSELDDSVLLRPQEACKWLSIGRSTLFELIASGELASVKVGRARRVPVGALRSYVTALAGG